MNPPVPPRVPTIPPLNVAGLLPPFIGNDPVTPANMSPYRTNCVELVESYSNSAERITILQGLLYFRRILLDEGFTGFQWLAGSFLENIETIENRAPRDIDVVTFFYRPQLHRADADWAVYFAQNQPLFSPHNLKKMYFCDAYPVDLDAGDPQFIVERARYWFGLFSHRRITNVWKGLLQLQLLDSQDETDALAALRTRGVP